MSIIIDMKVFVGILFAVGSLAILAFGFIGLGGTDSSSGEFLRLHIRANSNSAQDQAVKYKVKQAIIDDFTPIFSTVTTRDQAFEVLSSNLRRFESIANTILATNGFDYTTTASLRSEHFPERSYNGFNLPAGMYEALIIELGQAQGNNWWCVIYPPLCFLDNNIGGERGVIYRSRLQEIIRRFF